MAEDSDSTEEPEVDDLEEGEDDDLYAMVTSKSSPMAASTTLGQVEEDDSVYHKIEFMQDVPLHLCVEIGQTNMSVKDILALNVDTVIEFTKVVGEPMDITVSGRLMARGEIVVVNERYGVRISEVTRPDETEQSSGPGF